MSFNKINTDIGNYLLSFLDPKDLCELSKVCKDLNNLSSSNNVWKNFGKNIISLNDASFSYKTQVIKNLSKKLNFIVKKLNIQIDSPKEFNVFIINEFVLKIVKKLQEQLTPADTYSPSKQDVDQNEAMQLTKIILGPQPNKNFEDFFPGFITNLMHKEKIENLIYALNHKYPEEFILDLITPETLTSAVFNAAINNGYSDKIIKLFPLSSETFNHAMNGKNEELIIRHLDEGINLSKIILDMALESALSNGFSAKLLRRLMEKGANFPKYPFGPMELTPNNKNEETMAFVLDQNIQPTARALNHALRNQYSQRIIYRILKDVEPDKMTLYCALEGKQSLEVINLILKKSSIFYAKDLNLALEYPKEVKFKLLGILIQCLPNNDGRHSFYFNAEPTYIDISKLLRDATLQEEEKKEIILKLYKKKYVTDRHLHSDLFTPTEIAQIDQWLYNNR